MLKLLKLQLVRITLPRPPQRLHATDCPSPLLRGTEEDTVKNSSLIALFEMLPSCFRTAMVQMLMCVFGSYSYPEMLQVSSTIYMFFAFLLLFSYPRVSYWYGSEFIPLYSSTKTYNLLYLAFIHAIQLYLYVMFTCNLRCASSKRLIVILVSVNCSLRFNVGGY